MADWMAQIVGKGCRIDGNERAAITELLLAADAHVSINHRDNHGDTGTLSTALRCDFFILMCLVCV